MRRARGGWRRALKELHGEGRGSGEWSRLHEEELVCHGTCSCTSEVGGDSSRIPKTFCVHRQKHLKRLLHSCPLQERKHTLSHENTAFVCLHTREMWYMLGLFDHSVALIKV